MAKASGPLKSKLLSGNERLQNCAQLDPFNVRPGAPPSDHVRLIQEALRLVSNAKIPASEKNYGDATTKAVVAFKKDRSIFTRGTITIDPIVGINTIRELDKLLGGKSEPDGDSTVGVTIRPDTAIQGDVDFAGFSAARLSRSTPGDDWTRRDPLKLISQMVPIGQTRKLLAKTSGGAAASFSIDDERVATIVTADQGSVTIKGAAPGQARLRVSVEGFQPVLVNLLVRAAKAIPLDVFHLGPGRSAAINFQTKLLPGLNQIYASQANLTFTAGAVRDVTRMVMDGVPTAITDTMSLFFSSLFGPPVATEPTFRFADLMREVKNSSAVTVFISPWITDKESPDIAGRGQSRTAWFTLRRIADVSQLTVPAHEIGHALGLPHITAPRNDRLLMNPTVQANNLLIPAETLEDLNL